VRRKKRDERRLKMTPVLAVGLGSNGCHPRMMKNAKLQSPAAETHPLFYHKPYV
jgi:hypothetical protein